MTLKRSLSLFIKKHLFICSLVTFFGFERLYHQATDGFSVLRIQDPSFLLPTEEPLLDTNAINAILSQPFRFLSSGAQCYAFVSDDGLYVIKFLKCHHLRTPPLFDYLPLNNDLLHRLNQKKEKKTSERFRHFQSYHIAENHLKDLTYLIYSHLHQSTFLNKIKIFDKIGCFFEIDLNKTPFLLQKKGDLFWNELAISIKNNDEQKVKNLIQKATALLYKRLSLGIYDKDPDLQTNFGLLNDEVFQLDIGRFSKETREVTTGFISEELTRILTPLRLYLSHHYPYLENFIDESIESCVNK